MAAVWAAAVSGVGVVSILAPKRERPLLAAGPLEGLAAWMSGVAFRLALRAPETVCGSGVGDALACRFLPRTDAARVGR